MTGIMWEAWGGIQAGKSALMSKTSITAIFPPLSWKPGQSIESLYTDWMTIGDFEADMFDMRQRAHKQLSQPWTAEAPAPVAKKNKPWYRSKLKHDKARY